VIYPITPEYIANLPIPARETMARLEEYLLKDICERLTASGGDVTATAREHILMLKNRGYDMKKVSKEISRLTGIAEKQVQQAITDALQKAGVYYSSLYGAAGSDIDPITALQADLDAITRVTACEMQNITRSLGFIHRAADGTMTLLGPAETYQKILDEALVKVDSGISYNTAINDAVRQLADSGLQTVTYSKEPGPRHTTINRADVALRRAIQTGVTKISQAYADKACEDLQTPYVEVTAHAGARDVDKPNPWSNHKAWQGKVYSRETNDIFSNVYDVCGLGEVDGLCGANCRHTYHPYVPGVSQRAYSDDDLKAIDKPPFEYNGRKYTQYQASQVMRRAETRMRDLKRRMIATSAAGDREGYTTAAARYKAVKAEYANFADAAGLRSQMYDRAYVYQWGPKEEKAAEAALQEAQAANNT